MELGKRIKLLLEIEGKAQKDLANFTKVSASTVSRWINGKIKPDCEQLWYIALFLKTNIINLYGIDRNFETLLTAYEKGLIKIADLEL